MGEKRDFKSTMNLPETAFPMRANLATREPGWLAYWDETDMYRRVLEANADGPIFILHDGPPYANGHIHMGTAFNKVLKDLIVKYKSMRGFYAPYVPGWDCHGQPIEHQVEKNLGPQKMAETSQSALRVLCREYAMQHVGIQKAEFQRLGVRGDFDDPYLTLKPEYEAGNVKVFAELYRRGLVYKGSKPIHWCTRCKTALAEAEIEYSDEISDSIYVKFTFTEVPAAWAAEGLPVSVLIWTTTPWTLPANVAVTLAPDADYVGVRVGDEIIVLAEALAKDVAELAGWSDPVVLPARVKGSALAGSTYHLPIHTAGTGVIITGEHVELSTGTGAVHTAPGHGEEDYLVGQRFGLPTPMPVDDNGYFDEGGGPFAGMYVEKANPEIIEWLRAAGTLVWAGKTNHSYPHCWRCKKPVIFRATEQWFISMDRTGLRDSALAAIASVNWVPGWSVNRITSMVTDRPDWCISRQRAWGVPIPVFKCAACGETVATDATFAAVEHLFATQGADAWFTQKPSEYLPAGTACPRCSGTDLSPESDIVDVWFESGVSHTSVLDARPELRRPAELYLEGSDQHRGWFQSSLLTSVGAYGTAPFESVLTHGFIVDGDGRKMSKSLGNVISPLDVIAKYGADVVRLWVASADYSQDVGVSDEILERTSEAYRRIRNTFRFLLGNVSDFTPADAVPYEEMPHLDRFALVSLGDLVDRVTKSYEDWKYHAVYRNLYDYCVVELSAFYLDVIKDRLYADAAGSPARRSAQTVLAAMLVNLVRLVAPILSFTAEEVWQTMPAALRGETESVQLAGWPQVAAREDAGELRASYAVLLAVREAVTRELETARNSGVIGKSQEARLVVTTTPAGAAVLAALGLEALAETFIVSAVEIMTADDGEGDGVDDAIVKVAVLRAEGEKCPRCWNWRELGADGVCARCGAVLAAL